MKELLAACLDAPDDIAPRMVYADWLEQQGHPFAAVLRASSDDEAMKIAAPHLKKWFGKSVSWFESASRDRSDFDRGLLRRVYGGAGKYVAKAAQRELLDVVTVFGSRATLLRGQTQRLPGCDTLAWTRSLSWLDCQLDDERISALASSPHVAGLTALSLEKVRCTNAGLQAVAASPQLRRVRAFGLPAPVHLGSFDAAGVLAVVEALPLDSFELGHTRIPFTTLVDATPVAKLKHLKLGAVSPLEAGAIARATQLTALEELHMFVFGDLDDRFAESLLANPTLARLRMLAIHPMRGVSAAMLSRLSERFTFLR